jgi:hypothetical protein
MTGIAAPARISEIRIFCHDHGKHYGHTSMLQSATLSAKIYAML